MLKKFKMNYLRVYIFIIIAKILGHSIIFDKMIKDLAKDVGMKNQNDENIDKMRSHYDIDVKKMNSDEEILKTMFKLSSNVYEKMKTMFEKEYTIQRQ